MKQLSYRWRLSEGYVQDKKPLKVFGAFVCGGGSTMGYKLAGCSHLGGVEIDKRLSVIYDKNHNPEYFYSEDIRDFNKRNDLPKELYDLDILDGSPPCSTFSIAGKREKGWGVKKAFAEGQVKQELDDLVFVYCDTILKLKPKVFILENVRGLIQGNAKAYSKSIVKKMREGGYNVQAFLLNSATMGVPQQRIRVFFIGRKKELSWQDLKLRFNEKLILFKEIKEDKAVNCIKGEALRIWQQRKYQDRTFADTKKRLKEKGNRFTIRYIHDNEVPYTIIANDSNILFEEPRMMTDKEIMLASSFPLDYNFNGMNVRYVCGMSVPPLMIARIVQEIKKQWFNGADNG